MALEVLEMPDIDTEGEMLRRLAITRTEEAVLAVFKPFVIDTVWPIVCVAITTSVSVAESELSDVDTEKVGVAITMGDISLPGLMWEVAISVSMEDEDVWVGWRAVVSL